MSQSLRKGRRCARRNAKSSAARQDREGTDRSKKFSFVNGTIDRLEARSVRKAVAVKKYRLWGLLLLVAVPLPGTGAWTGALVADLLDIRLKHAFPVIAIGVLIAGAIMSAVTYGIF